MRNLITLTLALFVLAGALTGQTRQKSTTRRSATKSESIVISVPTVICETCDANITKAVKKVAGVKSVNVDLKKKTATVLFASGKTTLDKLENAISKAGYDANNTKRDPAAYEKLDACCKKD